MVQKDHCAETGEEAVTGRLPFPTFLSGDENIASEKGRKFGNGI